MDVYWLVPITGKGVYPIGTPISTLILTSTPRWHHRQAKTTIVVWDIQTGVVIRRTDTKYCNKILFHGDQRIITLVQSDKDFSVYDVLNGTQLLQGAIQSLQDSQLGAYWIYEDALQFTISTNIDGKCIIKTYKYQKTSTPSLCVLSSFFVPTYKGRFSFSPVSFHGSFITATEVIILDIQNSKLLLYTKVAQSVYPLLGYFSPDGCFFACGIEHRIFVWQNTPTGYLHWSSLRPRLPFQGFSWSPTSTSILCWGSWGIQLLHLGDHPSPLFPDRIEPERKWGDHLVAYSTDWTHIAVTQEGNSIITVLDCLSGTTKWLVDTDMHILEIKMAGNTIFVVDEHQIGSWDLKPGGIVSGIHELLAIGADVKYLTISHDFSWVAFTRGRELLLYGIKPQDFPESIFQGIDSTTIQFSPNENQLWFTISDDTTSKTIVKLDIENWNPAGGVEKHPKHGLSWTNLFSPCGHYIGIDSGWVTDPRGNKLLWLPPHWRAKNQGEVRWKGDFLAFVGNHHPTPIIIKFQS